MTPVDRLGGAIFVLFLTNQVGMIIIVNSYFAEFGPAGRFALMFAFFKALAICMILFASMAGGAMGLRFLGSRRVQIVKIGNGRS